jgi:hypothetical protein
MIPTNYLRVLSVADLHTLFAGQPDLDLQDMQQHMTYGNGYHAQHQVIVWFWNMLQDMPLEQRKQLLVFWSGSHNPPLYGFSPKVCVVRRSVFCFVVSHSAVRFR